jgi:hypothetical protein
MNISDQNHALILYLVSFEHWGYEEYGSFVVVACSEVEASQLTPDPQMNHHIGIELGYDCPEPNPELVKLYRDSCGTFKSIRRMGDAWAELGWGDVPIYCLHPY